MRTMCFYGAEIRKPPAIQPCFIPRHLSAIIVTSQADEEQMSIIGFLSGIRERVPDLDRKIHDARFEFRKWTRTTLGLLFNLLLLFLAVWGGHALILGLVKYSWFLIRETHVGMQFLSGASAHVYMEIIGEISGNIILTALHLNRDAFTTCLAVGLAARFFCAGRYFYDGRGAINHLAWFIAAVFLTRADLFGVNRPLDSETAFFLYFLPVCCMLDACMTFSTKLLPEAPALLKIKDLIVLVKRIVTPPPPRNNREEKL